MGLRQFQRPLNLPTTRPLPGHAHRPSQVTLLNFLLWYPGHSIDHDLEVALGIEVSLPKNAKLAQFYVFRV